MTDLDLPYSVYHMEWQESMMFGIKPGTINELTFGSMIYTLPQLYIDYDPSFT